MSGIYIHIPFCKQACHYCDFHFSTVLKNKNDFLAALKKEIRIRKDYLKGDSISTIYFGGGTPSLLSEKEMNDLFDELNQYHHIEKDAEITLEANPDDLTINKISELKQTPINRLSIGIQSFFDVDLKLMNRAHNAEEALQSVKIAQDNDFKNITIDLIYAIPGLTNKRWIENLDTAFSLNISHISAYCLTVEKKTALYDFIKKEKIKNVDEEKATQQFEILIKKITQHHFEQYEISNFAKQGFYSRHNSNYWLQKKYLGLGPSAHSYDGTSRQWNIANNAIYIRSLENDKLNYEKENLSQGQQYNEYILTSLRTIWGIDLGYIKETFGEKTLTHCLEEYQSHIKSGNLTEEKNKLFLTVKGKLLADKVSSDLFIIE